MSTVNRAPEGVAGGFVLSSIETVVAFAAERVRIPRLALIAAVGLLAVGAPSLDHSDHTYPLQVQPAEAQGIANERHVPRTDCTTFRIAPNDIYAGSGCGQEGATAETVDNGHLEKGWAYSAIVTGGVKKCFFVRQGVLPKPAKSDTNLISTCSGLYSKLVEQKDAYLTKFNCKFLPGGLQGCRSGTSYTPIVSTCRKNVVYRNYATAEPSPWNADGQAPTGLSEEVSSSQGRRAVSYRVEIKDEPENSHATGAVVIRGILRRHGWGLMYPDCPDQDRLIGGTPTISG